MGGMMASLAKFWVDFERKIVVKIEEAGKANALTPRQLA